MFIKMTRGFT